MKTLQQFLLFTLCIITLRLHSAEQGLSSLRSSSEVDARTFNRCREINTETLFFPLPAKTCCFLGFLAGVNAVREGSYNTAALYVTVGFAGMYLFAGKKITTSRHPIIESNNR